MQSDGLKIASQRNIEKITTVRSIAAIIGPVPKRVRRRAKLCNGIEF